MFSIRATTLAVTLAACAASLAGAPLASAKGGPAVRVQGVCTQTSSDKLKLSRDEGRIEVEFQVDQNRNGVPWHVTLRRNGALVASTTATTRAPSGSFTFRRLVSGTHGNFVAVATRSGERCSAHAGL